MTPLMILLAIGLIGVGVIFIIEVILLRQLDGKIEIAQELIEDYQESLPDIKKVVNTNATALRASHSTVQEHDARIAVLSTLTDILLDAAKVSPELRSKLEEPIEDLDIEVLVQEDT